MDKTLKTLKECVFNFLGLPPGSEMVVLCSLHSLARRILMLLSHMESPPRNPRLWKTLSILNGTQSTAFLSSEFLSTAFILFVKFYLK